MATRAHAVFEYGAYLDEMLLLVRRMAHTAHLNWHLRELLREGWIRGE